MRVARAPLSEPEGRPMKTLTSMALIAALPLVAQAQNTLHSTAVQPTPTVTSVSIQDMRDLVTAEGHTVGMDLDGTVGIMATTDSGLSFLMRGQACQDATTCLGLEVMVVFNGAYSAEFANTINQRWSAIKATSTDSALLLSRYLILDGGQTNANLQINLRNTIAIADSIQAEAAASEPAEPVPADEPETLLAADLQWGDDTGDYANDGACDDARFESDGDDWSYQRAHVLRDATDCRAQFEAGELTLYVDFGDNSGDYINDGTCDDNRFTGEGRSILETDSQVKRDAVDCIEAYRAGTINRPS